MLADPPTLRSSIVSVERAFSEGDPRAACALLGAQRSALYALCLRLTRNAAEAEDAAQEAMARALMHRRQYDPSRPFGAWLLTIGANLCRDRARSAWLRRVLRLDVRSLADLRAAEQVSDPGDVDARVRRALERLPGSYREALALYYLDELSYDEMALRTGASVAALRQRVRRGQALLRVAMERMYSDVRSAPPGMVISLA